MFVSKGYSVQCFQKNRLAIIIPALIQKEFKVKKGDLLFFSEQKQDNTIVILVSNQKNKEKQPVFWTRGYKVQKNNVNYTYVSLPPEIISKFQIDAQDTLFFGSVQLSDLKYFTIWTKDSLKKIDEPIPPLAWNG